MKSAHEELETPRYGLARWPTASFMLGAATVLEGLLWPAVYFGSVSGSLNLVAPALLGWLVISVTFLVVLFGETRGALQDRRAILRGEPPPPRGRGVVLASLGVVLAINLAFVAIWAK